MTSDAKELAFCRASTASGRSRAILAAAKNPADEARLLLVALSEAEHDPASEATSKRKGWMTILPPPGALGPASVASAPLGPAGKTNGWR